MYLWAHVNPGIRSRLGRWLLYQVLKAPRCSWVQATWTINNRGSSGILRQRLQESARIAGVFQASLLAPEVADLAAVLIELPD